MWQKQYPRKSAIKPLQKEIEGEERSQLSVMWGSGPEHKKNKQKRKGWSRGTEEITIMLKFFIFIFTIEIALLFLKSRSFTCL